MERGPTEYRRFWVDGVGQRLLGVIRVGDTCARKLCLELPSSGVWDTRRSSFPYSNNFKVSRVGIANGSGVSG